MTCRTTVEALFVCLLAACGGAGSSGVPQGCKASGGAPAACGASGPIPKADLAPTSATVEEVQHLFDRMGAAGRGQDIESLLLCFDIQMTVKACEESGVFAFPDAGARADAVVELTEAARANWLAHDDTGFDYDQSRVLKLLLSADGEFGVASVLHFSRGERQQVRWWLSRRTGGWRVYDWEEVDWGVRSTWYLASVLAAPEQAPAWQARANYLQVARTKLAERNVQGAREYLTLARDASLPRELEAARLTQLGACDAAQGKHNPAIRCYEEALALVPNLPAAIFLRAASLYALKRYEPALADLQAYTSQLGETAAAQLEIAECLLALQRTDEARSAFVQSLEEFPTWMALRGLAECTPPESIPLLGEWFLKLSDPKQDFAALMSTVLYQRRLLAAAAEFIRVYAETQPADANMLYARGRLRIEQGKPAEAIPDLQRAFQLAAPSDREEIARWQLEAHYRAGSGPQAIAGTKDVALARFAFRYLAHRFLEDGDASGLDRCCDAWEPRAEGDASLPYYRGESSALREDWPGAEIHFRAGLAVKDVNNAYLAPLRRAVLAAMQKQGKAAQACKEWTCNAEEFLLLESLVFDSSKADALAELIEAYRQSQHDKALLARAEGDLEWLREQWKRAASHYSKYVNPSYESDAGYRAVVERFIRACIRSSQAETAAKWAKSVFSEPDDHITAIASAAADLPGTATNALFRLGKKAANASAMMQGYYDDADVGAKLRTPAYAKLHERYPPPRVNED